MTQPVLKVLVVSPHVGLPKYATPGSAGLDLQASIAEPLTLNPGERRLIPSGLKLAIPEGYEGQVRPRSGLANKHGISMVNTPGTVDSDYRNEVGVLLINHGQEPFTINPGDRVAQMVIAPVTRVAIAGVGLADDLGDTERGLGGWGSTGR